MKGVLLFLATAANIIKVSVAESSPDVPALIEDLPLNPQQAIDSELSNTLVKPEVLFNAASLSTIKIDTPVQNNPCGEAINVTGSLKCLEEYHLAAINTGGLNPVLPYDNFTDCTPYKIEFLCDDVTASSTPGTNPVTSDPNVMIDRKFDTAWVHKIQKDSPISITLEFPAAFRIDRLIISIETIPIAVRVSSSLNGSPSQHIITYQLAECPFDVDEYCEKYEQSKDRLLAIYLSDENFEWTPMDKLTITFPGETTWKGYNIEYLIIKEIHLESTCACKNEICSAQINDAYPESKHAKYSCDCEAGFTGFYCDKCADTYYNNTVAAPGGQCEPCGCGPGSFNGTCGSNSICECNPELYDRTDIWDTKCQRSYISDLSPTQGPLQGGTLVTIKGGLLTQISIENCISVDDECQSCLARDQMLVCKMRAGAELGMVTLTKALTVDGVEDIFNFTYTPNFGIKGLSPAEAFASGGRLLTLNGSGLSFATHIALSFRITCVDNTRMEWTVNQSCAVLNDNTAECRSVNFCDVENKCVNTGSPRAQESCDNKNEKSVGATFQSVSVQWLVYIDGFLASSSSIPSKFTIAPDPVIFEWENFLTAIEPSDNELSIPGENLNSGASYRDYRVITNGIELQPLRIRGDGQKLFVSRPNNEVLGNTTVYLGDHISEYVGVLRNKKEAPSLLVIVVVPVVVLVVLIGVIVPVVVFVWRRKSKRLSLEKNLQKLAYKPGNVRYTKRNGEFAFLPLSHLISDAQLLEELKPFLIDKERLSLSTQLGSGQFGKVYKGAIQFDDGRLITVAAKTLKADSGVTEEIINGFLKEATLMSNFNHHNVLSLIGVVFSDGNMPIVILPYMHRGDVRALLHSDEEVFVLGDLLHFAMQIARGMEYLADRRFIHRDLAARNCMVDSDYMVKIADFGLSHDIYEDDYYRVDEASSKPLPVKWMAIESLNSGKYTIHSDVWSFGVVVWELLTRGVTPYPTVSNYEIKTHLQGGERLSQPQYCPDIIYDMMRSCWTSEPTGRPTFTELADNLASILDESHYEARSKTRKIESDYYLQPSNLEDLQELYVEFVE